MDFEQLLQRVYGYVERYDGPGDAEIVQLPDLTWMDVLVQADELLETQLDTGHISGPLYRQRVVTEIPGWLWDTIVEPVLRALPPGTSRVWWLPTGAQLRPTRVAGRSRHLRPDVLVTKRPLPTLLVPAQSLSGAVRHANARSSL
ncbi:hypothetical protein FXN61_15460 [Lentzea sp. PSKA42]|uniref:Uncharacterized protein n=1 Tax=Lentzea indica TaxID=2604800 RepID=A0ABX1FGQ9_9PSEU|nr:hypothetical protein [Lentzea indica]NKE58146.1 hypothetical protein [Lentzea indica]